MNPVVSSSSNKNKHKRDGDPLRLSSTNVNDTTSISAPITAKENSPAPPDYLETLRGSMTTSPPSNMTSPTVDNTAEMHPMVPISTDVVITQITSSYYPGSSCRSDSTRIWKFCNADKARRHTYQFANGRYPANRHVFVTNGV
jgi:hypothetical protein